MEAKSLVEFAVKEHLSLDVERVMALFADDINARWNGQPIAANKDELREWYRGFYAGIKELELVKNLRAADNDVLAVEWEHRRIAPDGKVFEGQAAEVFWLDEQGKLKQWHAYCTETEAATA